MLDCSIRRKHVMYRIIVEKEGSAEDPLAQHRTYVKTRIKNEQ